MGTLEDAQSRDSAKYDAMVKKYQKLLEDANLDKVFRSNRSDVIMSAMDTFVNVTV